MDSPQIADLLQFMLENRPTTFRLLIASRVEPGLNLARLRALDQVVEINSTDLRFSFCEEDAFLQTCMGVKLAPDELQVLDQSIEGWPAGLQLAGLALSHRPENIKEIDGRGYTFDYLAEEVLGREKPEVQDFLKRSACLERFFASCCARVMDAGESLHRDEQYAKKLIAYLDRANLFLVPLDAAGVWYRYHTLFGEFLRQQLAEEQVKQIYITASRWFEENELIEDAIQYAILAGDHDRADELLEGNYIRLLQYEEPAVLSELIACLPAEHLDQHARLWIARGWINILTMDLTEVVVCANKAESLLKHDQAEQRLYGEMKSIRILSSIFSGEEIAADELNSIHKFLLEEDEFLLSLFHIKIGVVYVMQGDTAAAVAAFNQSLRFSKRLNNPLFSLLAYAGLGESYQMRGELKLAESTFQQAIKYAKKTLGEQTILLSIPFNSYADLLRERNRIEDARDYAGKSISFFQKLNPSLSLDSQIVLARILAAQGNWDECFDRLETIIKIVENSLSVFNDMYAIIHMVRLKLIQGDLGRALKDIKAYKLETAQEQLFYHLSEISRLTCYRAKTMELVNDRSKDLCLIEELSALIAVTERKGRVTSTIEALILLAYAQDIALQESEAEISLSRALTIGEESGYLRIFADEGKRLLQLLEKYYGRIDAPGLYLDRVVNLMREESAYTKPALESDKHDLTPLARRELNILILVAEGKSNQEIAAERVLALSTVKKHVGNIISKLGVANRTQAVMLAKEKGWL